MRLVNLRKASAGGSARVSAEVHWEQSDRPAFELWVEADEPIGPDLAPSPEAFATLVYLAAMRLGEKRVSIEGTLCPRLRDGLATAGLLAAKWFDLKSAPPVLEPSGGFAPPKPRQPGRAACFYSGGIDATCTLLKNLRDVPRDHPAAVADAVFVHGIDMGCGGRPYDKRLGSYRIAIERLGAATRELGVNLVVLTTNLREIDPDDEAWRQQHGSALAALAHTLAPRIDRVYIASSFRADEADPHGSHPMLDPFFSSAAVSVIHDSAHLFRDDKVRLVCESQVALDNLRVCHTRDLPPGVLNCGRCEKCVRTMLELIVLGNLADCGSFPVRDLTPAVVDKVWLDYGWKTGVYAGIAERLRAVGRGELADAIGRRIDAHRKHVAWTEEHGWKGAIRRFDRERLGGTLTRVVRAIG